MDRLGCAPRALIALAHTAIATTSCVALNCVGTMLIADETRHLFLRKLFGLTWICVPSKCQMLKALDFCRQGIGDLFF